MGEGLFRLAHFRERLAQREVNENAFPAREPRQVVGERQRPFNQRIAGLGPAVPERGVKRPRRTWRMLRDAFEDFLRLGELAAFLERLAKR